MRMLKGRGAFPLPMRRRIGRAGARLSVATVVSALAFAVIAPQSMDFPAGVMFLVLAVPLATQTLLAFGPVERWAPSVQEWLLRIFAATAVLSVLGSVAAQPKDDGAGFSFLGFALGLSAVTLSRRDHTIVLSLTTAATVPLLVITTTNTLAAVYVVLPSILIGVLAGQWAHHHSVLLADNVERSAEAAEATAALRAVVGGASASTDADPTVVLQAIVEATVHLGAGSAAIYLIGDDGTISFGASHNIDPALSTRPVDPAVGLIGEVLRLRSTVHIEDYPAFGRRVASYVDVGLTAAIGTPVCLPDGEMIGILVAGRHDDDGFHGAAATAVELLAAHAARALELSRTVDQDRRTLRTLTALVDQKDDFVATVSHELRTPLTVIDGVAATLATHGHRLDDATATKLLDRLVANTTMLRSIVESLLDVAALDNGLVAKDESVDLKALLDDAMTRLSPLLTDHEITVRCDAGLTAAGDQGLVERVIDNLITNVLRHTPPGTRADIVVTAVDGRVEFSITDDGPGIPEAVLPRITERFVRAGDHHTRSGRGIGIGLALVDQILRLHGTRLEVSSTLGAGARFAFALPHVLVTADTSTRVSP